MRRPGASSIVVGRCSMITTGRISRLILESPIFSSFVLGHASYAIVDTLSLPTRDGNGYAANQIWLMAMKVPLAMA